MDSLFHLETQPPARVDSGNNELLGTVESFYEELRAARPLTIVERGQYSLARIMARSAWQDMQRGKLSIAAQQALLEINKIMDSTEIPRPLKTGNEAFDALAETLKRLTVQELERPAR